MAKRKSLKQLEDQANRIWQLAANKSDDEEFNPTDQKRLDRVYNALKRYKSNIEKSKAYKKMKQRHEQSEAPLRKAYNQASVIQFNTNGAVKVPKAISDAYWNEWTKNALEDSNKTYSRRLYMGLAEG